MHITDERVVRLKLAKQEISIPKGLIQTWFMMKTPAAFMPRG